MIVPDDSRERGLRADGHAVVAGLDEVGRGAWAGPVSVCVAVPGPVADTPGGLRDSKLVPERRRDALAEAVAAWCPAWSVGHAEPTECDALGMTAALRVAAHRALGGLGLAPDALLVDGGHDFVTGPSAAGVRVPAVTTVVGGDARCLSIAAASILAKVTRDRIMRSLAASFPAFDFDRNKGYPSPAHRRALVGAGLTSIHRRSWSFVDDLPFR